MTTGLRSLSAGMQPLVQLWYSGESDFTVMDWSLRLSAETISASGVSAFLNIYFPAGFTAFASGTASAASGMWWKMSATGTAGVYRLSAGITTTSAKRLYEWFDVKIGTGDV